MTRFDQILGVLEEHDVDFILIGGVAATAHGAARLTQDIDVVYSREPGNLDRVVTALAPYDPYPRGAPPGLPFLWDAETLAHGLNFTLATKLGAIDLLGEITGGGSFEDLAPHTVMIEVFSVRCRVLNLPRLIAVKRAAGRPKDFEAIAELEALLSEQEEG